MEHYASDLERSEVSHRSAKIPVDRSAAAAVVVVVDASDLDNMAAMALFLWLFREDLFNKSCRSSKTYGHVLIATRFRRDNILALFRFNEGEHRADDIQVWERLVRIERSI